MILTLPRNTQKSVIFHLQPCATAMFVLILLAFFANLCNSQRTADWDRCGCRWATWESWSKCSRNCYGSQRRSRKVWNYNIPSCEGFVACDRGAGGWQYQTCNKRCDAGYYNGYKCLCPDGRYGSCCEHIVTCAIPQQVENGFVHAEGTNYNDVITYSCEAGYNLTGNYQRKCGKYGGWSGTLPRCLFAEFCKSNPCANSGTCVDGLGEYTCVCMGGWDGKNCQIDIMPPLASNCSENVTIMTGEREVSYTWTIPRFHDPHANPVTVSSNYANNTFMFPWGDHTIQYTGLKVSNGMTATCPFTIRVRPHVCPPLFVPENGFTVCNGWKKDYGQFCLVGCDANYSLPHSYDPGQWIVCGASGQWAPAEIPRSCRDGIWTNPLFEEVICRKDPSLLKQRYIEELWKSSYNSFCVNDFDLCNSGNVDVTCD